MQKVGSYLSLTASWKHYTIFPPAVSEIAIWVARVSISFYWSEFHDVCSLDVCRSRIFHQDWRKLAIFLCAIHWPVIHISTPCSSDAKAELACFLERWRKKSPWGHAFARKIQRAKTQVHATVLLLLYPAKWDKFANNWFILWLQQPRIHAIVMRRTIFKL